MGEDSFLQSGPRLGRGIFRQSSIQLAVKCVWFGGLPLAILIVVSHLFTLLLLLPAHLLLKLLAQNLPRTKHSRTYCRLANP